MDSSRSRKRSLASQSIDLSAPSTSGSPTEDEQGTLAPRTRTGRYRPHAFFDNPPSPSASGTSTPTSPLPGFKGAKHGKTSPYSGQPGDSDIGEHSKYHHQGHNSSSQVIEREIGPEARIAFAHFGYIYALHMIPRPNGGAWLVSGSGDSDIKIWQCSRGGGLSLIRTFPDLSGAVHSFAFRDALLFAGMQEGQIGVWDLETSACIRKIEVNDSDVLCMSVLGEDLYAGKADGKVFRTDGKFNSTAGWKAHKGIVLSSTIVPASQGLGGWELITAGNDSYVKVSVLLDSNGLALISTQIWSIISSKESSLPGESGVEGESDSMLHALAKLVAVPTVSDETHRER